MILINIRPRFYYQTSFYIPSLIGSQLIQDISHFLHQTEQLIHHKINIEDEKKMCLVERSLICNSLYGLWNTLVK